MRLAECNPNPTSLGEGRCAHIAPVSPSGVSCRKLGFRLDERLDCEKPLIRAVFKPAGPAVSPSTIEDIGLNSSLSWGGESVTDWQFEVVVVCPPATDAGEPGIGTDPCVEDLLVLNPKKLRERRFSDDAPPELTLRVTGELGISIRFSAGSS